MQSRKTPIAIIALLSIALGAVAAIAATDAEAHDVDGYPGVQRKPVTIWSDGTRLAGDVFLPKGLAADQKVPAIVLCHGWGGMKSHLNQRIAPQFASAGYAVLAFDYRGWGESDGRLVVRGEMPKPDADGNVTVKAQLVREVVDPLDQEEDIDAAISFMTGEPHVDAARIGIWGSSLGGSHVIWRAGNDPRVKAVVSQVGGYFPHRADRRSGPGRLRRRSRRSAPAARSIQCLRGTSNSSRSSRARRIPSTSTGSGPATSSTASTCRCRSSRPRRSTTSRSTSTATGPIRSSKARNVPVEYHLMKGIGHYDIYRPPSLDEAMKLEIAFFDKYLKKSG